MNDSQTNQVFFSSYFTEKDTKCRKIVDDILNSNNIPFHPIYGTKDIWARDYMPVQIAENRFVRYKYEPDYLEGRREFQTSKVRCEALEGAAIEDCDLILDGGNIVICGNKMILTEKVFRENKGKTPFQITKELERAFNKQVIYIPCDLHEIAECEQYGELPLCHADGILSVIDDETILLANYVDYDLQYRAELLSRLSPYFKIKELSFGNKRTENSWIYINYLRIGDVVLLPVLGEPADELAIQQIKEYLNTDKVFSVPSKELTFNEENGGGSLHCISWNIYRS